MHRNILQDIQQIEIDIFLSFSQVNAGCNEKKLFPKYLSDFLWKSINIFHENQFSLDVKKNLGKEVHSEVEQET